MSQTRSGRDNTGKTEMGMTYKDSGVDTEAEGDSISALVKELVFKRSGMGAPANLPGHFTGAIEFGDWLLSMCTDGVGTKMIVAEQMQKWDTVGIDCVAMNVNDVICIGAEPLAFVDYLAIEKYDDNVARQIGAGLNRGAEMANMSIVGGELATLPEIVRGFDLAGTCLGAVKKGEIITGQEIQPGDAIIALESSGLHSNGYTLARRIVAESGASLGDSLPGSRQTIGEALLEPTRIYVKAVMGLLKECKVKGMANITGGGLKNILRLKPGLHYEISKLMPPQPIFEFLKDKGGVDDKEMHHTFNMGYGFAIIIEPGTAGQALDALPKSMSPAIVGEVKEGAGLCLASLGITYDKY